MNDRFKFRVWSYEQKKMYYWSDCVKKTNFIYGMFVDHRMLGRGSWDIEQCTGLKDKNGNLIYEGDIILVPYIDPIFYGVWNKENTEKSVVEFYKGCWIVRYLCDNKKIIYLYDFEDKGEIIGNIHENKDLE